MQLQPKQLAELRDAAVQAIVNQLGPRELLLILRAARAAPATSSDGDDGEEAAPPAAPAAAAGAAGAKEGMPAPPLWPSPPASTASARAKVDINTIEFATLSPNETLGAPGSEESEGASRG